MKLTHERIVLVTVVCLIAIQVLGGLLVYAFLPDWDRRGQFGDMFGAVSTLFSGLAFAGVIYAILLQREDLALQREELRLTREELHRSAEAQEKSEKALSAQAAASKQSAQLAAINYLLDYYTSEAKTLVPAMNIEHRRRMAFLEARRGQLLALLNEVFESVTNPPV